MATVFITGGHAGIGLECARQLAARGFNLVLAGRSPAAMQSVADELRAVGDINVATVELDLSSLESVRSAAAHCTQMIERGEIEPLDALICNAGGRFDGQVKYSPEGYELTFATNCLGHFLLVDLLLPVVSADGRVVFTASGTHDPDTMDGKLVGAAAEPNADRARQRRQGRRRSRCRWASDIRRRNSAPSCMPMSSPGGSTARAVRLPRSPTTQARYRRPACREICPKLFSTWRSHR